MSLLHAEYVKYYFIHLSSITFLCFQCDEHHEIKRRVVKRESKCPASMDITEFDANASLSSFYQQR